MTGPRQTGSMTRARSAPADDTPHAAGAAAQAAAAAAAAVAVAVPRKARELLRFHELEAWRQDNEWIMSGYRTLNGSYAACLDSLLFLHNETGNIYSHLLGGVFFVGLMLYTFTYVVTDTLMDQAIFSFFFAGSTACLFLSAAFHTMCCHSHEVSKTWNKCDYVGVTFMIVGSSYPSIYYAFHCDTLLQIAYLALMTVFGALTIPLVLLDRFSEREWRTLRAWMYVILGVSGVFPMVHTLATYGLDYALTGAAIDWSIAMGLFYLVGAFLYGSRIPERHFPGRFDYWLHSHQIFHLLVVIAALLQYVGLLEAYDWHKQNECTSSFYAHVHAGSVASAHVNIST